MARTQEQRQARRDSNILLNESYKIFFSSNPELKQKCKVCLKDKELKHFVSHYAFKTTCLECHREKIKSRRKENHIQTVENARRYFKKSAAFILSLKINKNCEQCGNLYPPSAMDFHHKKDKEWTISKLYGKSPDRILKEIEKCVLICANCHRNETQKSSHLHTNNTETKSFEYRVILPDSITKICKKCGSRLHELDFPITNRGKRHSYCIPCKRTYERNIKRDRKNSSIRKHLIETKDNQPCEDCGKKFRYWQLDFDHTSNDKIQNINKMQTGSLDAIKLEITKCDLVCAACHRVRTQKWKNATDKCTCGYLPKSKSDNLNHIKNCTKIKTDIIVPEESIKEFLQKIELCEIKIEDAQLFLDTYHYGRYGRNASRVYAAKHMEEIVAVIKFCPPIRKEVATSLGWDHKQVLELDRFCIHPKWQVKNLGSKVLSLVIKQIKKDYQSILALVSFADSNQNHVGTLYKASNWIHIGQTSTSYIYLDDFGVEHNKKTVYEKAKRNGMSEHEWASKMKLTKQKIGVKEKFVYELI